jgi:hypothetical protein
MPPASARKASARSAIRRLRSCMVSTMCSSVQSRLAHSLVHQRLRDDADHAWRRRQVACATRPSGRCCRRRRPAGRRALADPAAHFAAAGTKARRRRARTAVDADRKGASCSEPHEGGGPDAEASSSASSTAALPMSLARLDRIVPRGRCGRPRFRWRCSAVPRSSPAAPSRPAAPPRPSRARSRTPAAAAPGRPGLLAEGGFAPAGAQAGQRIAGGVPDAAEAGAQLLRVGRGEGFGRAGHAPIFHDWRGRVSVALEEAHRPAASRRRRRARTAAADAGG